MQGLVPILIWASLIATGLSLAMMLAFGLKNVLQGKVDVVTAVILGLPAVGIGILTIVMDTMADAFIFGVIGLLVVTALSLLISSFRTIFGL